MNTDQANTKTAQPSDESLKRHGDQLEKQVKDVTGKQSEDNKTPPDNNVSTNQT